MSIEAISLNFLRSQNAKEFWKNPEARKQQALNMRNSRAEVRVKRMDVLGENQKEALRFKFEIECLTIDEVAHQIKAERRMIMRRCQELGVEPRISRFGLSGDQLRQRLALVRLGIETKTFSSLTLRQRTVLERLYLSGLHHPSLTKVGVEMGLTRERIRALEKRGLARLEQQLIKVYLSDPLCSRNNILYLG
ncbi:MAG: sigma factor-like helix-turn-helix DNA-binding protein [Candidatus Daviesbacteria bacterium]